jgi:hypothetical protein
MLAGMDNPGGRAPEVSENVSVPAGFGLLESSPELLPMMGAE